MRVHRVGGWVRGILSTALVMAMLLVGFGTAQADSTYHTERLVLAPVGAEGGSGQVVNIHPNGPVVGAQERYQLKNARPDTEYQVWLVVNGADFMQTATIVTDRNGNGHAKARFSAADVAPFSGAVLSVRWELRTGSGVAYRTETTTVTLD